MHIFPFLLSVVISSTSLHIISRQVSENDIILALLHFQNNTLEGHLMIPCDCDKLNTRITS